jgi:hypothetical protein
MPPRTGPRRKKRSRSTPTTAPRHFAVIRTSDEVGDIVVAHRVELNDGNLVFRDQNDAISHILAEGEWRDVHPASVADMPLEPDEPDEEMSREQATLVGEHDLVIPPEEPPAEDRRFVPSSPEEAQRILMEMQRRLKPQPDPDAPPPPAPPRDKE